MQHMHHTLHALTLTIANGNKHIRAFGALIEVGLCECNTLVDFFSRIIVIVLVVVVRPFHVPIHTTGGRIRNQIPFQFKFAAQLDNVRNKLCLSKIFPFDFRMIPVRFDFCERTKRRD